MCALAGPAAIILLPTKQSGGRELKFQFLFANLPLIDRKPVCRLLLSWDGSLPIGSTYQAIPFTQMSVILQFDTYVDLSAQSHIAAILTHPAKGKGGSGCTYSFHRQQRQTHIFPAFTFRRLWLSPYDCPSHSVIWESQSAECVL